MEKEKFNIGILAANLTDVFSNGLIKGAISAAKRLDVNLTVIPGKYLGIQHLNDQYDAHYEYQYNVLFSYAAKAHFDYIIAPVGTIAYAYNNELKKQFLDTFAGTPVLCVASDIEGYDCLEFDNRSGIRSAVRYLAKRGRKHIGIMAGNLDNSECRERYEAYLSGLAENGLEYKDSYLMQCDMSHDCSTEAEKLLNINPELDAVICINDIIASVVYTVIQERGRDIGKDIAVIGFDDQPFAKELDPPLATVKADAYDLGSAAVEKAVNFLKGTEDNRHFVDTVFFPRQSCFADTRFLRTPEKIFSGDTAEVINNLKKYISEASGNEDDAEKLFTPLADLICLLEKEFIFGIADETALHSASEAIDKVFTENDSFFGEIAKLYSLHENLYVWLMRNCKEDNLPYIKKLFHSFGKKLREMTDPVPPRYAERTHLDNLFIRDSLMLVGDSKESYGDILRRLHNIGSVTSYLYTLDAPITHYNGDDLPEDLNWLFRSYCYGANCFNIPETEQPMKTPVVFNNEHLVSDRARILIAVDLFSAETQYGIALLEPESFELFDELELITYQLSSAVRTLDILKNLNKLLTDTKLALALANDYKYIYCIDMKNDSYVKYERDSTEKDFEVVSNGTDFYKDCKAECELKIHKEDRSKFKEIFDKSAFTERTDSGDSFSFDYRYLIDDVPVYYHLKTIKGKDENEGYVFIGVTDINAQKQRDLKATEERRRLAGISNALASRYELLFYINAGTGEYTAYSSNEKDSDLKQVNHGHDFFGDSHKNIEPFVHHDDLEMLKKHTDKDNLLALLSEDENVSFTYRTVVNDNIQYMNMTAVKMTDKDDRIIIAVGNITSAKMRELELKREMFRDSLTGVKNKSAYTNIEKELDSLIKEGVCEEFSIAVFDLNDLKKINDNLGHDEGDKYIRSGSSLICRTFKHSPVFRIGGDEFAAVLKNDDYKERIALTEKMKAQVEENKRSGGAVIAVGIADYLPESDKCVLEVFKRADKEMYADKRRLKNDP